MVAEYALLSDWDSLRSGTGRAMAGVSARHYDLATSGVMAGSGIWVTAGLANVVWSGEPRRVVPAVLATAFYLPLHLRHVHYAAHGQRPPGAWWTLAAMTIAVVAMLPLLGVQWIRAFNPLGASLLLVLRPPWSLGLYLSLGAALAPLTYVLGTVGWASFFRVAVQDGTARLEIINDRAHTHPVDSSGGQGLAGLATRAEALSGSVTSGQLESHRFQLVVEIPREAA